MNENQLTLIREYEFDTPLSHTIDSIIDNFIRDCQIKNFPKTEYKCVYDNKLTKIGNN